MYRLKRIILGLVALLYISVFFATVVIPKPNDITSYDDNLRYGIVTSNNKNYNSLQSAINDNASEIRINENLCENVIIKDKTIVIDGNNNTLKGLSSQENVAIMDFDNCSVTIRNLIIDGDNLLDDESIRIGLFLKSSSLYLENVQIININHSIDRLDNYPKGYAIYYVNDDKQHVLDINKCRFTNFHESAIYINNRYNDCIDVSITNNYIEGTSSELKQYAIILKGELVGNIEGNEFVNLSSLQQSYGIVSYNKVIINQTNNMFNNVDVEFFNRDE